MDLPEFLVQDAQGDIRLTGHRIGLFHVVTLYKKGYAPAMLAAEFPTLPLALIHQVISLYLANRPGVDEYVRSYQADLDRQRAQAPRGPTLSELQRRLEAKEQTGQS
jgi:uncharacterized protein (DUF433 family)